MLRAIPIRPQPAVDGKCSPSKPQALKGKGRADRSSGPSLCPYSPKCVEEEFSEVHSSKQLIRRRAKHSATAWRHPFGVQTRRLSAFRCTVVYQGVATRNGATTREIPAHQIGARPNFACTGFSEAGCWGLDKGGEAGEYSITPRGHVMRRHAMVE